MLGVDCLIKEKESNWKLINNETSINSSSTTVRKRSIDEKTICAVNLKDQWNTLIKRSVTGEIWKDRKILKIRKRKSRIDNKIEIKVSLFTNLDRWIWKVEKYQEGPG